jgi:hypothetical protein
VPHVAVYPDIEKTWHSPWYVSATLLRYVIIIHLSLLLPSSAAYDKCTSNRNISLICRRSLLPYVWWHSSRYWGKPQQLANAMFRCYAKVSTLQADIWWYWLSSAGGTFPSAAGHVATTTLLADMLTFLLPDVLVDLRSSANPRLRYQARSLLAQNGQKRNWHPFFCQH